MSVMKDDSHKNDEVHPHEIQKKLSGFNNWISLVGIVVSIGSVFAFLLLFVIDLLAGGENAYLGILTYLVAPGFLFAGLFLIFGGWIFYKYYLVYSEGHLSALTVSFDLTNRQDRNRLLFFACCTIAFMMLTAIGSYQTYHYTESTVFCGEACHAVMEPEYVTYKHTAHANIACVECHIGSGATWYFRAKISGLRQVYRVLTKSYERPVDTPIANLRPAKDTCLHCHSNQKVTGYLERTYAHYLTDEENTEHSIRMLLNVGAPTILGKEGMGIHWHAGTDHKIEYIALDHDRQEIPWIRLTRVDGSQSVFKTDDFEFDESKHAIRAMDCLDCHNRPAHQFKTPNQLVDESIQYGRMNPELLDLKFNAVDILMTEYTSVEEARDSIREQLTDYYDGEEDLENLISEMTSLYEQNLFPAMNADWRHYPEHSGHKEWLGCFRCHDERHHNELGRPLKVTDKDCSACHTILAQGQNVDQGSLSLDGLEFEHPWDSLDKLTCSECHNGALQ